MSSKVSMAIIQIVQWNGHLVWLSMWHYVKQLSYLYKKSNELGILKQIDTVLIQRKMASKWYNQKLLLENLIYV